MGAREILKDQTRRTLAECAIRMFTQHGYDNVTMEEVALAASVSRRTAFRYFPSKDDLVMQHPAEWLKVFNETIEARQELPLASRLQSACLAVAAHIEADPLAVRQLFGLASAHPSLAGRYAVSSAQWIDRISEEIHLENPDTAESRMIAAAFMGIINTACEIWASTEQPLAPLIERGLALLTAAIGNT